MTYSRRWQDAVNLLLGLWLIASPVTFGLTRTDLSQFPTGAAMTISTGAAAYNMWVVGIIVAVAAAAALISFHVWEEWVNAVLGLWLIVSPWLMGYGVNFGFVWNQVLMGLIVATLAIWAMASRPHRRIISY